MRFTVRRVVVVLSALTFLWLNFLTFNYVYNDSLPLPKWLFYRTKFDDESFIKSDSDLRIRTHYSNFQSSYYKNFLKLYHNNVDAIKAASLEEKCSLFLNDFLKQFPDWSFDMFQLPSYSKDIVKKKLFFENHLRELRKEGGDDFEVLKSHNITIDDQFKQMVEETIDIEQNMADTMTLLRIFGKCLVENSFPNMGELYRQFADKLFPAMSKSVPKFTFNKEDLPENSIPKFDDSNEYTGEVINYDFSSGNLVDFLHKKSNGRGILISATTRHARDVTKLIRVLRALNNKLPIQISHRGDLSERVREYIDIAATCEVEFLLDSSLSKEHETFKPELNLQYQYKDYGSTFPKQNIFYVDIVKAIKPDYKWAFSGYSNKVLALLFTSFKEVIVFDADSVPLVPIEEFFESTKYKLGSAYFFQDRSLRDHNDWVETNYFTKLCPTKEGSIDDLFGIPLITEKTLGNKYLTGWRHFQEAGVVVIDRTKHFLGILAILPLLLWKEPVKASIWGDKELYWLGLSLVGDETYEFNDYAAGSVGQLTEEPKYKYYPSSDAHELCSSHPGHVDANGKLLWINSGFNYCKNNAHYRDQDKYPFLIFEEDTLAQLYKKPVEINAVVIPPDLPKYREPGSNPDISKEVDFKYSWELRKKDYDEMENVDPRPDQITEWGPQKGWVKSPICYGYQYCGYDVVEGYGESEPYRGSLFRYDNETIRKFEFISKMWFTGTARVKPQPKEIETEDSTKNANE